MFFGQTFLNFPLVDYLQQQLSLLIQNNNLQTYWPVHETNIHFWPFDDVIKMAFANSPSKIALVPQIDCLAL